MLCCEYGPCSGRCFITTLFRAGGAIVSDVELRHILAFNTHSTIRFMNQFYSLSSIINSFLPQDYMIMKFNINICSIQTLQLNGIWN
jgi:hypothetical protein